MTTTSTAAEVQNRVPGTGSALPTIKEDVATSLVPSSMPATHHTISHHPISQPISHTFGHQAANHTGTGFSAPMPAPMPALSHPMPQHTMPVQVARLQARVDTVYSNDWGPDEQVTLDATLDKFSPTRHTPLERYTRAAAVLPKKGVRDVALRVKWLATHNAAKRRMVDDSASKKRSRVQSIFAVQPKGASPLGVAVTGGSPVPGVPTVLPGAPALAGIPPVPGVPAAYPPMQAVMPTLDDHGAGTVGGVGGPMAQLLEQNYLLLNQYKQNMQQYKVHENTELLVRFRDNILNILNQMNSMTGLMQHMPPLPVQLNLELAATFLPKSGTPSMFPMAMPHIMSGAMQGSMTGGGAYMPPHMPAPLPMQPSALPGATSVPSATGVPGANLSTSNSSPQQNGKSGGQAKSSKSSKSKNGTKKQSTGTVKVEPKVEPRGTRASSVRSEPMRSSSRTTTVAARNEQKTPIKSEGAVKTSARLAAAAIKSGT